MANAHRGEIAARLDGRDYTLCLTLGALAEMEAAFAARDLVDLAARFDAGRISSRDLLVIIGCGLRGAGHAMSDAEVSALKVSGGLPGYVRIAADLLAATFGDAAPMKDAPANPPTPQDA